MLKTLTPKKITIILLILLSVLSLVYLALSVRKNQPSSPTPSPSSSPVTLQLLSTYPASGKQSFTFPNTAVSFTFNQAINIDAIQIEISPVIKFDKYTSKDKKILYIKPLNSWVFDTTYTIQVKGLAIPTELSFTPTLPSATEDNLEE